MKTILFALTLLALSIRPAPAGPLDAPGVKAVTVGTEFQRGRDAMTSAAYSTKDLDTLERRFDALIDTNKQANKDSEGFMLGLRMGYFECVQLQAPLSLLRARQMNNPPLVKLAQLKIKVAAQIYRHCRDKLREMGIADADLAPFYRYEPARMTNVLAELDQAATAAIAAAP